MNPWTTLASTVVLGIGANTENLPVGLAYGLRGMRIGLGRNLLIAGVTTVATVLPLDVGQRLRGFLPAEVPNVVAGLLLIGLGISNFWIERRRSERQWDMHEGRPARETSISFRETLALAFGLSINNIGLGFAGGIAGLGQLQVALSVAGFSILLLWLGEWLSRTMALPLTSRFSWLNIDGNLLIICVGVLVMAGL